MKSGGWNGKCTDLLNHYLSSTKGLTIIMNKKEVAEIRRQYVPERCTISRICGCYVDAEKNIKTTMKEAFLSLPEDDAFKYFTIFKKTLIRYCGTQSGESGFPTGRGT